jgi:molecular chaperone DnaK
MGDKMDADTKAKVEAAVARVRDALSKDDVEEMKSAMEALTQIWHQAASKMYSAASGGQGGGQGGGQSGGPGGSGAGTPPKDEESGGKKSDKGDGPVDADFEVVE